MQALDNLPPSPAAGAAPPDRLASLRAAIADLRARRAEAWGREAAPRRSASRCPSGLPALDAALGGGFARGHVHELVTSPLLARSDGAAAHTVALLTATRAAARRGWILYVDTTRDLYPPGAGRLGVPLGRLLVVRATRGLDALWVCEQALRSPGVAAVVAPLQRLDAGASRRLQLAAEAGGGLGLLLRSEPRGVPAAAKSRTATASDLRSQAHEPTFSFTRVRFDPLPGDTEARRLLVTVLKLREGRPPEPFVMELPDDGWGTPSVWMPRHAAQRTVAAGEPATPGGMLSGPGTPPLPVPAPAADAA
jgi:protein ImuA